ncbi:ABC transporter ATP-binding protein [Afifella pfennigii]|uniref:ABC transporter ATP-binding protein n=1 Tax=Afifella pfennigii TaxID=209897 RepID=UPI000689D26A|nr:ABC transporter ATP-binding protein [Afifella pfennigii]
MSGNREIAVRVENLGKRYLLPGAGGGEPLRGPIWVQRAKARFPALRREAEKDWFWALSDVSLEVPRGEVLGIIGRNGAGKSTLLKLLSGITVPTTGRAEMSGRVGSLLEVGTGFHPDLTGRQNIFVAAALIGISVAEARRNFDAIVDYADLADFIDVPVKRYSSGMYMRLAFAVTALLESDILLLDEVLAVGDANFQKKTKASVAQTSHEGRTVLFVSHSMQAIRQICTRCIWIDHGRIVRSGTPEEIVEAYLETVAMPAAGASEAQDIADAPAQVALDRHEGYYTHVRGRILLEAIETLNADGRPATVFSTGEEVRIRVTYRAPSVAAPYIGIGIHTMDDERLTMLLSPLDPKAAPLPEAGTVECVVPALKLTSGDYSLMLELGSAADGNLVTLDSVVDATRIRISLDGYLGEQGLVRNQGFLSQRSHWQELDMPVRRTLRSA